VDRRIGVHVVDSLDVYDHQPPFRHLEREVGKRLRRVGVTADRKGA
jgi:hypothetical protein